MRPILGIRSWWIPGLIMRVLIALRRLIWWEQVLLLSKAQARWSSLTATARTLPLSPDLPLPEGQALRATASGVRTGPIRLSHQVTPSEEIAGMASTVSPPPQLSPIMSPRRKDYK